MSKKKKKKQAKKSDVWKYKVGNLTAYERKDRSRAIWTRVGPNELCDYEQVRALCGPIRDPDGNRWSLQAMQSRPAG